MKLRAEVCILGSGVAGGVIAQELLDAGIEDVLMVEAGSPVVMRDTRTWYDVFTADSNPFAAHTYQRADYDNVGPSPIRLKGKHLRARGGSTLHWAGLSYRLKPEDFRLASNTGRGLDWPIAYGDLEPYYALAESTLQVAGEAADPGHPPRSGPFPLPAFPAQEIEADFIQAMKDLGFSTQHACVARNSRSIHGMSECLRIGTCEYCPVGGRFTGDQLIARLEERPGFRLLSEAPCLKLRFSSRELAVSADLLQRATGERHTVEAGTFVICAGGVESPKLLLASANDWWPKGVGNQAGRVGRFLTDHVYQKCSGRSVQPNRGRVANQLWFTTTASRHFDDARTQASGKFLLTTEHQFPPLRESMVEGKRTHEIARELEEPLVHAVQFQLEQHPSESNFLELGSQPDSIGLPRTVIHHGLTPQAEAAAQRARTSCETILREMGCTDLSWNQAQLSSHISGTCRMSRSPDSGVVDENLKVHDTRNLYLCSNAVFPSVGAANPTVTIVALAHRLGRHLGRQTQKLRH